jgi:hypothetical protein
MNKLKQKEVFKKFNALYKPSNDLELKPLTALNSNSVEKKQSRLQSELNKQIEIMRKKRLAAEHLMKYPLK